MDNNIKNSSVGMLDHEFEMPECEFCATCGNCKYYEQYAFGKAYCNYHHKDVSSLDSMNK